MSDPTERPDKLTIRHPSSTLDKLPPTVRARVEDMRRVGGMLSTYARISREADRRRKLLSKATNLGQSTVWRTRAGLLETKEAAAIETEFASLAEQNYQTDDEVEKSEIRVDNTVGVNTETGHRLALEAELLFFHMALEQIPKQDNELLLKDPLLHSLKRLRNIAVHFQSVPIIHGAFSAVMLDESESPRAPIRLQFPDSWFIVVDPDELLKTQGPKDRDLFVWFQTICSKQPAWFVLQAAVERLCDFYQSKT